MAAALLREEKQGLQRELAQEIPRSLDRFFVP